MKTLTNKQIEKLAQVVEGLFNIEALEIADMNEMLFAYCNHNQLIEDGTEEWMEKLIDNMNGGGYDDAEKCYNDIFDEYKESKLFEAKEFDL